MGTARSAKSLGPTGQRTARNLRELRGRIPVRELSKRLTDIGQPILPSGITKIEQGDRRVDVDDLVALAMALNVSPNRLLLDPESDEEKLSLTEGIICSRNRAWNWATGSEGLPDLFDEEERSRNRFNFDELSRFKAENRPNELEPKGTPLKELFELGTKLAPVLAAIEAVEADGISHEQIMEYLSVAQTLKATMAGIAAAHPENPADKPKRKKPKRKKPTPKGPK